MDRMVTMALAAALVAPAVHAQDKRCQLQEVGEIAVSTAGPSVIADGEIDGQPVRLAVDTGSDMTMLYGTRPRNCIWRCGGATAGRPPASVVTRGSIQ